MNLHARFLLMTAQCLMSSDKGTAIRYANRGGGIAFASAKKIGGDWLRRLTIRLIYVWSMLENGVAMQLRSGAPRLMTAEIIPKRQLRCKSGKAQATFLDIIYMARRVKNFLLAC
jgi:hypothetical protein